MTKWQSNFPDEMNKATNTSLSHADLIYINYWHVTKSALFPRRQNLIHLRSVLPMSGVLPVQLFFMKKQVSRESFKSNAFSGLLTRLASWQKSHSTSLIETETHKSTPKSSFMQFVEKSCSLFVVHLNNSSARWKIHPSGARGKWREIETPLPGSGGLNAHIFN